MPDLEGGILPPGKNVQSHGDSLLFEPFGNAGGFIRRAGSPGFTAGKDARRHKGEAESRLRENGFCVML